MDYKNEKKIIDEGGNFWKPETGQHQVVVIGELEASEPFIKENEDGTKRESEQFQLKISVNKIEKLWTMGRGNTLASSFGQLVALGAEHKNLNGLVLTVAVKSNGNKKDFTIFKA